MDKEILREIGRLPNFGTGAVRQDDPDDAEANVRMTVGDIRTIRRLKEMTTIPDAPGS